MLRHRLLSCKQLPNSSSFQQTISVKLWISGTLLEQHLAHRFSGLAPYHKIYVANFLCPVLAQELRYLYVNTTVAFHTLQTVYCWPKLVLRHAHTVKFCSLRMTVSYYVFHLRLSNNSTFYEYQVDLKLRIYSRDKSYEHFVSDIEIYATWWSLNVNASSE